MDDNREYVALCSAIGGIIQIMKREWKFFIGLSLIVFLGAATSGQHQSHSKRDEAAQKRFEDFQKLKMELSAEGAKWKVGEPIKLTLKITNPGTNDVGLSDIYPDLYKYKITVTGSYYQPISETDERKLLRMQGRVSALATGVKSNQALEEDIPISRYYQMNTPGIYRIKVKRLLGSVSKSDRFYLESNTLTISVIN
jgi:hypothetical protein